MNTTMFNGRILTAISWLENIRYTYKRQITNLDMFFLFNRRTP